MHIHMMETAATSSKAKRMKGSIYGKWVHVNHKPGSLIVNQELQIQPEIRNQSRFPSAIRTSWV